MYSVAYESVSHGLHTGGHLSTGDLVRHLVAIAGRAFPAYSHAYLARKGEMLYEVRGSTWCARGLDSLRSCFKVVSLEYQELTSGIVIEGAVWK